MPRLAGFDYKSPFAITPDHIHLLIKIRDIPERQSLGRLVYPLRRALSEAYWRVVGAGETAPCKTFLPKPSSNHSPLNDFPAGLASGGFARPKAPPPPIFAPDWHDWIVKRKGQLAAFGRYIRENPERAALRRANARFFRQVAPVDFLGRRWFAYGNRALLDLPAPIPLKGHRATKPDFPDWNALLATAARIRPGGAGVSTFMSPLEKACGNAIARAGGAWIILSPEGFSPRWHPPREKERFCARAACSTSRSTRPGRASRPAPNSTTAATKWSISPSPGLRSHGDKQSLIIVLFFRSKWSCRGRFRPLIACA